MEGRQILIPYMFQATSSPSLEVIHQELTKAIAYNKDLLWELELLQSELTELGTKPQYIQISVQVEEYKRGVGTCVYIRCKLRTN